MANSALDVPVFQIGDIVKPIASRQWLHGSYERKVLNIDNYGNYMCEDRQNKNREWSAILLELVRRANQPDNEYGEVCP